MRVLVRKLPAIIAASALLVSLSACATGAASIDGCVPSIASGSNAALVTADGSFGNDPKATFPTPLVANGASEAHVISDGNGNGKRVAAGATTVVQLTIYDGKTGDALIATNYDESGALFSAIDSTPAFGTIAQCARVGSRVAAVGTAADLIGDGAIQQNGLSLAADDTVAIVVDVQSVYLGKADGADQVLSAGFPSIVLAPDGRPGFTFADPKPPTALKIETLKAGSGAKVEKDDRVVLHYTGVLWDTQEVFDSTWERNAPAMLVASSLDDSSSGLVPGFAKALIGQRVGSQVIAVIPPKDGYPAGQAPTTVPDGSTMVFVFDILGIE
ncbi:peptidylprolyl isomerase [Salinibacterium sp. CAN_S4]|uniref:FKBP-type peptidyl-prolyl cis-trans isomerase n=1 Tax=Salinibacterium sp. CAN_S4 TaxID=2787727 RepID=UPI0018EFA127